MKTWALLPLLLLLTACDPPPSRFLQDCLEYTTTIQTTVSTLDMGGGIAVGSNLYIHNQPVTTCVRYGPKRPNPKWIEWSKRQQTKENTHG